MNDPKTERLWRSIYQAIEDGERDRRAEIESILWASMAPSPDDDDSDDSDDE